MKRRIFAALLLAALCRLAVPASASGLGDVRVNARFLTDRMAFELNLSQTQYDGLFEINFDFFNGVDPYVAAMARSEAYALDAYYRYLDERNDDIRWILSSAAFARFMALEYFFRPIYALNHVCYVRVYKVYPDRSFFYFGRPPHYLTYCGAHARHRCGGASYYRAHFSRRYHHPVYRGDYRCRPEHRRHDFRPSRPGKGPGYHFTPVPPSRPAVPPRRPQPKPGATAAPQRPAVRPAKPAPSAPRPVRRPSRPEARPSVPDRPSRPETRPSAPSRPSVRPWVSERPRVGSSRPERKESPRSARSSRSRQTQEPRFSRSL